MGRLDDIPGFAIDEVAAAAGADPDVLRMENLDTDLPPPADAVRATEDALRRDDANSYLPFTGRRELRARVAEKLGGYDPDREVVITCGGTEGLLVALFAVTQPGDEVVVTDPTYAGIVNRVRLAGAVPRFAPLSPEGGEWHLSPEALRAAVGPRTRALLLMSPSMPSGAVLDWEPVVELARERDLWIINDAAMERILFDGRVPERPARLARERTLTVGSVSKEHRMIGWRVGWVVGPAAIMADVARAHIYTVVTPPGVTQDGALAALDEDIGPFVAEWERRRDLVMTELAGLPVVRPGGGWSLLLDVAALGHDAREASRRLLERGRIAATPMVGWGDAVAARHVRLVYSNEPPARLAGLGARVRKALT